MTWSSREVRALLRNLRKPDVLEWLPLTMLLKSRFETATGYEAVLRLVNEAFAGHGRAGARLRELLQKYDLEGNVNRDQAASEMALSTRQFARYRAHATEIIAQHLSSVLAPEDTSSKNGPFEITAELLAQYDPQAASRFCEAVEQPLRHMVHFGSLDGGIELNQALLTDSEQDDPIRSVVRARTLELAGSDAEASAAAKRLRGEIADGLISGEVRGCVERELLKLDLQRSFHVGDAAAALAFAEKLRRQFGASDTSYYLNGLIDEAETALLPGELVRAEEVLTIAEQIAAGSRELLASARCLLVRAKLEFVRGHYPRALQLANAALVPLGRQPAFAIDAHAIVGRVSLLLNLRWKPTMQAPTEYRYRKIETELIACRHVLAANLIDEAELAANASLVSARDNGYRGLESYALATLACIASQKSDGELAQELYACAWRTSAPLRNAFLGRDLFTVPKRAPGDFGPMLYDQTFYDAISDVMCAAFPKSALFGSRRVREELQRTIVTLVRDAASVGGAVHLPSSDIGLIVAELLTFRTARDRIMEQKRASIDFLATSLAPLLPPETQADFTRRLCGYLENMFAIIARELPRSSADDDLLTAS
ncbi:MAG: hypothetical protein M3Y21_04730 [Candidatus Eremiobacteraeota bacterium]|nr:hypothetical protein [Candidatus Eremiobacteraeota bacterium]